METKQTSKREFAFVIFPQSEENPDARVDIIDKAKQTLRTFKIAHLPESIVEILVVHGLKQKLTDDTMVSKIGEDGDRLLALDGLWDQLKTGEWEKERQGIARPPEALIRLVSKLKSVSRLVAEASLKEIGKERWDAIAAAHKSAVDKIAAEIKAEKAAVSTIDLTSL